MLGIWLHVGQIAQNCHNFLKMPTFLQIFPYFTNLHVGHVGHVGHAKPSLSSTRQKKHLTFRQALTGVGQKSAGKKTVGKKGASKKAVSKKSVNKKK